MQEVPLKDVRRILERKGHEVWSVGPEDRVFDAISKMAEKECGALAVMEGKKLVGIVSERDYTRKVILKGRASKETCVREIMTTDVSTCTPDLTADECMALMTDKRVRHLPVIENDEVVGMLSIGDLVKNIIADQEFVIEQLENYIYS